jgi:hypothetical protein
MIRIGYFDSCSDGTCTAVNLIANIGNLAGENFIAVCVCRNVHLITCLQTGEVRFENVGDDPYALKINVHERSRTVPVDYCSDREIALDQRASDRRDEWKIRQWLTIVGPLELADLASRDQQAQPFTRGFVFSQRGIMLCARLQQVSHRGNPFLRKGPLLTANVDW